MLPKKIMGWGGLALALWFWPLAQGKEDNKEVKNPLAKDKAAVVAGREQFEASCAVCHGPTGGGGRGPRLAEAARVRAMNDKALFDIIKDGVKGTEMPPLSASDTQAWQLVSFIRSLNARAIDQDAPGNVAEGESLFFGRARCAECHMIRGRGGPIGPDLSNIGSNHSLEKIREAIQDPSAVIEPGFQSVTVQTRDGRRRTGVAKNESNYSIQIQDAQGRFHLFLKKDLREVMHHQKSLMPVIALSDAEMKDLLSFLSRQSIEPPAEEAKPAKTGKEKTP